MITMVFLAMSEPQAYLCDWKVQCLHLKACRGLNVLKVLVEVVVPAQQPGVEAVVGVQKAVGLLVVGAVVPLKEPTLAVE